MSRAEAIVEQARGPVLLRVARDVAKAKYDCVLMRPTDVAANGHAVWRAESGGMQMYYSVESSWCAVQPASRHPRCAVACEQSAACNEQTRLRARAVACPPQVHHGLQVHARREELLCVH